LKQQSQEFKHLFTRNYLALMHPILRANSPI